MSVDFFRPYRVVTPTLEGPILRVLAGAESSLTRTQIRHLVEEASEAGIRKALERLVNQGIVVEESIGGRYLYQANRDHLLWPSIEGLFNARRLLRERVEQHAATWAPPPISIGLFGSIAAGTADEKSDVDILVVRPSMTSTDEDGWERQINDLQDSLMRWTGNPCDVIEMSLEELHAAHGRNEPIVHSPIEHLTGTPVRDLLTHAPQSHAHQARKRRPEPVNAGGSTQHSNARSSH